MKQPNLNKWPTTNREFNVFYWEVNKALKIPQMVEWLAKKLNRGTK